MIEKSLLYQELVQTRTHHFPQKFYLRLYSSIFTPAKTRNESILRDLLLSLYSHSRTLHLKPLGALTRNKASIFVPFRSPIRRASPWLWGTCGARRRPPAAAQQQRRPRQGTKRPSSRASSCWATLRWRSIKTSATLPATTSPSAASRRIAASSVTDGLFFVVSVWRKKSLRRICRSLKFVVGNAL